VRNLDVGPPSALRGGHPRRAWRLTTGETLISSAVMAHRPGSHRGSPRDRTARDGSDLQLRRGCGSASRRADQASQVLPGRPHDVVATREQVLLGSSGAESPLVRLPESLHFFACK
jgi:hypothetical protein